MSTNVLPPLMQVVQAFASLGRLHTNTGAFAARFDVARGIRASTMTSLARGILEAGPPGASSGARLLVGLTHFDIENLGSGKLLAKSYPFPPLTCNDCPLEPEDVSLAAVGSTENIAKESKVLQGDLDLELEVEIGEVREESRGGSTATPPGLFN